LEGPDDSLATGAAAATALDANAPLMSRPANHATSTPATPLAKTATRRGPFATPSASEDGPAFGSTGIENLPVIGAIASRFSRARRHPLLHIVRPPLGVDVAAPRGTQITAPAPGRVSFVGRKFGFGLVIEIVHGNGVKTRYAHCGRALVALGAQVARGMPIATVGTSGLSTGPHLHYEVLVNGRQVDPLRFRMPQAGDNVTSTPALGAASASAPATPAASSAMSVQQSGSAASAPK
jgi:murein DD-endopeptidase MepM/ murein hydrolase activator NlpD